MSSGTYDKLSEERKKLQAEGEMPEFWSTGGWQLFKNKYLYQADTPKQQYTRIAKTLAAHTPDPEVWGKKFFDLMWKGWLSPSTPILANTGTARGLPVSCAGSYIGDSINDIYEAKRETAMLTKMGFGTAGYLGDIRCRGTPISTGGTSTGVLPVIEGFQKDMEYVAQGTARRGSWAGYLPIDHGDFDEVCTYLEQQPDGNNIGWCISDEFISKLENRDPEALRRYAKALKTKLVSGKGYYFFHDKANAKRPKWYVDQNLDIKASQLCVAPETQILTSTGYVPISTLAGKNVDVWNGKEWSNVVVYKTGVDQKLLKVVTKDGYELECTPDHKFYKAIRSEASGNTKIYEVSAKDLRHGDKLIKFDLPVIEGSDTLENAYINGFFTGDGCEYKNSQIIYLYGDKRKLGFKFDKNLFTMWNTQDNQDREILITRDVLRKKFFVPSTAYTVKSRLDWFAGLLDSDGTVVRNGKTQGFQVSSVNKDFLKEVQLMLQTLGVTSKVTKLREKGKFLLPKNDGSGELGEYDCKEVHRLLIGNSGLSQLKDLGLITHRLVTSDHKPNRECSHFIKVLEVIDEGRVSDTYCFTEPKRHMGMFNGVLTGQCSEIVLHSSSEYTYTCVLASMNLVHWDEFKDTDAIFEATVFLDCVCQEFIERAKNIKGLEKAVAATKKGRALGLGVCGFGSYLQSKMIPFESLEAHLWNTEVFSTMQRESIRASEWIASVYGEPEWLKGYGRANSHCLSVAPTKSTALIMGGVSEGINPDTAMVYTQRSAGGEIDRVNPYLLKLMKEKGVYTQKHVEEVRDAMGSVQGVSWLSEEEKAVFKTAFEIDQHVILRLASTRGNYIDQWVSLNLFFAAGESESYVNSVHKQAFLDPNILALYYVYSMAGIQASNDKNECTVCQ